MLSSARVAQFGVVLVVAVLVLTLGVLASRAAERQLYSAPEAPLFALADLDGRTFSLKSMKGKVTVLVFSSARCPVSNRYVGRINALAERFAGRNDVQVLVVETAEEGAMPSMPELTLQRQVTNQVVPTLLDHGAKLAKAYDVTETPTVCIIDETGGLRYRGAFDDNRDERNVRVSYAAETVNRLVSGLPTRVRFTETTGCSIRRSPQMVASNTR